jgi:protein phosphatase 2C family protein 2/3
MVLSRQTVANLCAGIWDCLTSQQCVDVVRLLISQGKDLPEVAEIVCELCLAPDTESGAGIGCDNMTMLVVAILNGKTKDEWKAWVTDRVTNGVGHATPDALPQLYSQSRLTAFKTKRAAEEAREKDRQTRLGGAPGTGFGSPGFGLTRILGSTGGISFRPGEGILSDRDTLMFGDDDTDSDDSDDMDSPESRSFFSHTFGFRRNQDPPPADSANKSLKEQLDVLEQHLGDSSTSPRPNGKAGSSDDIDVDADPDSLTSEPPASPLPKTETPPPPKPQPNGTTMEKKPHQFTNPPGSDEAAPAVKAEGLMDTSESPLKG